jgi:hypothetical protein
MRNTTELHQEVNDITELNNILRVVLVDRFLCDSKITGELFSRYIEGVQYHLKHTESGIFSQLLTNSDDETCTTVERFMDGAREIKQIFAKYSKKWCKNKSLIIKDHEEFLNETEKVFDLILRRLQDETENLYPLVQTKHNR